MPAIPEPKNAAPATPALIVTARVFLKVMPGSGCLLAGGVTAGGGVADASCSRIRSISSSYWGLPHL